MMFDRSRRSLLVLALALLAAATPLDAQTATVTVRVLVAAGDTPIEGASVSASGRSAITDPTGTARLSLPPGDHRIAVARIGFQPTELVLRLTAARDTVVVIRVTPQAVEAEGIVVVSSTRTDRRIDEEPLRIEVVSREEVEEKLLMTPGDISMLLNETAGLRVQPTAPVLGGATVRIQGLRGRYTQILTDGLPLYGGQAGALGPLQVPPMDLARVEVIKGAASALYGPTALGGVVNLISRRPDRAREVILNQSTLDGTDLVGWLADEFSDRWGYTLLASAHRQDFFDADGDGWADVPDFERISVRPRLFWEDGRGSSAMFTLGGMIENRRGGSVAPGSFVGSEIPLVRESLDTRRFDGGLNLRRLLSGGRILTVRGSGSIQAHDHRFTGVQEEDEHRTAFGEVALSGQNGRHLWVVGAAIQHDTYAHDLLPGFDFDYTVPGLFAQDEWSPSEALTLAASVRWDHHDVFGSAISPRLSALARVSDWAVRLSGGAGWFAPTPFTDETDAVGLERLTPPGAWSRERARNLMVDVGREFGPLEMNVSAFGSVIDDPLQTVRNGDGTLTIENADGEVRTWGTETFAALRTGPWRLIGSHAWLHSREPDPQGDGRREVPLTPRHSVGVVGAYEREDWGRIGVEAYYTGRQELDDDPFRDVSRRHLILGLLVDRKLGRFRVFLNAENLLDTRQTRLGELLRPTPTPEGRWTTDVWAPLEGRAFNAGVWVSF